MCKEQRVEAEVAFTGRQKEVNKKLRQMLNISEKEKSNPA